MTNPVSDSAHMARALRLAERGLYTTMPNPRVGCVLVDDAECVAEGWHRRAGEAHAEADALARAGERARGTTAYVTLEPCSHTGRTGPCCDALIAAGVSRVVYGMEDPNPKVAGRGLDKLRAAGIEVSGPVLEDEARALNPGFIKRMEHGRPLVRCKLAMSLDGRTAMASGESKWVTSRRAREDVQRLRARSCAIITGIETVLLDRASLTVRAQELQLENAEFIAERQPLRVILDSRLRLPLDAPLLEQGGPILLVHAGAPDPGGWPAHVETLALPSVDERIDLSALLVELARRECNEVLVETGAVLAGGFLARGLLDELIIYMAPKLLGSSARPLFNLPLEKMSGHLPLKIQDIRALGQDWRITASPDPEG
ncbi:bifunctional diaminohydroxyphosphoribosylaminopyrimidine deaminase/5-amino-6-(5-phosphoribosylamino)uracil reductase RibD [Marinimicrobium sp. ABcell2]|uniref:bifunctional diaminohydroxyphosphoribosylaminopyrimidine deaminase/5-amino-6-(5-phosphoribosylamino)uracil reductase RibD n=1 Tax=Marinimicrobium sp. ABcell2 TaxID=3069751 RepID=UPI0027AFAC62|nr:bifunctional diaminohydroxyphosphoribosylaminopyrimidine deaminase/5-amino-6-(5-phosphoribosylamino)uracil reductase RibD [Marinimicrobium sp. ABcell2]MDQ2075794.1 bifunctional diaminohydroxyphosphoribosylaminopyrimidine deaminase/5-amino-6-(5-phosphoribosylamino)uracil reductase RibD [Marinimicrobium sp. ABcell2]